MVSRSNAASENVAPGKAVHHQTAVRQLNEIYATKLYPPSVQGLTSNAKPAGKVLLNHHIF